MSIERVVWTVKYRVCAIRSGLPFCILPPRMIIKIMASVLLWLNASPPVGDVFATCSPCNIILGSHLDYNTHCRLSFEAYAQVHDNPDPLNITGMNRTIPGICLGPTGNSRGSYTFLNFETGRVIKRYQFTEYPITPAVQQQLSELAKRAKRDEQNGTPNASSERDQATALETTMKAPPTLWRPTRPTLPCPPTAREISKPRENIRRVV